jgi:hypothetical protein
MTSKLTELTSLTITPQRDSIESMPKRALGMDPRVLRDIVSDHLSALHNINKSLPQCAELDAALRSIEMHYDKVFGERLTELLTAPSAQMKVAVLELRRQLKTMLANNEPANYDNIDEIMTNICEQHDCTPTMLHDVFVDTFNMTPDEWYAAQQTQG